jgi:hypothetical protein
MMGFKTEQEASDYFIKVMSLVIGCTEERAEELFKNTVLKSIDKMRQSTPRSTNKRLNRKMRRQHLQTQHASKGQ